MLRVPASGTWSNMVALGDSAGLLRERASCARCTICLRSLGTMGAADCGRAAGRRPDRFMGRWLAELSLSLSLQHRSPAIVLIVPPILGGDADIHDLYSPGQHGFSKLPGLRLQCAA